MISPQNGDVRNRRTPYYRPQLLTHLTGTKRKTFRACVTKTPVLASSAKIYYFYTQKNTLKKICLKFNKHACIESSYAWNAQVWCKPNLRSLRKMYVFFFFLLCPFSDFLILILREFRRLKIITISDGKNTDFFLNIVQENILIFLVDVPKSAYRNSEKFWKKF